MRSVTKGIVVLTATKRASGKMFFYKFNSAPQNIYRVATGQFNLGESGSAKIKSTRQTEHTKLELRAVIILLSLEILICTLSNSVE